MIIMKIMTNLEMLEWSLLTGLEIGKAGYKINVGSTKIALFKIPKTRICHPIANVVDLPFKNRIFQSQLL